MSDTATAGATTAPPELDRIMPDDPRKKLKLHLKAAQIVHRAYVGGLSGSKYNMLEEIARLSNTTGWLTSNFDTVLSRIAVEKLRLDRAEAVNPYSPVTMKLRTQFLNSVATLRERFAKIVEFAPRAAPPARRGGGNSAGIADIVRDFAYMQSSDEFDSFVPRHSSSGNDEGALPRGQKETRQLWLVCTTKPITLTFQEETFPLGRFEMRLKVPTSIDGNVRVDQLLVIKALEPFLSRDRDVPHPHVRGGRLCMGEGAAALSTALKAGRLFDFFCIVNSILNTYNPGSPYVPLDSWVNTHRCRDCRAGFNDQAIDERRAGRCGNCNQYICGECGSNCTHCSCRLICSGCGCRCDSCNSYGCRSCRFPCGHCRQHFCAACDTANPYPTIPAGYTVPTEFQCDLCPACNNLLIERIREHGQQSPATAAVQTTAETSPTGPEPRGTGGVSDNGATAQPRPAEPESASVTTPTPASAGEQEGVEESDSQGDSAQSEQSESVEETEETRENDVRRNSPNTGIFGSASGDPGAFDWPADDAED